MRALGRANKHAPLSSLEQGVAYIEMAIIMPLLLTITFGIIQFGYFLAAKILLQNAATIGARTALLPGSTVDDVTAIVSQTIQPMLKDANLIKPVVITYPVINGSAATKVALTYNLDIWFTNIIPGTNNSLLTMNAASVMRK